MEVWARSVDGRLDNMRSESFDRDRQPFEVYQESVVMSLGSMANLYSIMSVLKGA